MELTMNEESGKIIEQGVICFKRLLCGLIGKVWVYHTESEKRARWLTSGETELK